jgi:hypothetical protein
VAAGFAAWYYPVIGEDFFKSVLNTIIGLIAIKS